MQSEDWYDITQYIHYEDIDLKYFKSIIVDTSTDSIEFPIDTWLNEENRDESQVERLFQSWVDNNKETIHSMNFRINIEKILKDSSTETNRLIGLLR